MTIRRFVSPVSAAQVQSSARQLHQQTAAAKSPAAAVAAASDVDKEDGAWISMSTLSLTFLLLGCAVADVLSFCCLRRPVSY